MLTAVIAAVVAGVLGLVTATPAQADALPSKKQWVADVHDVMYGSRTYVKQRVADRQAGEKLAINFDIDNTAMASHYHYGAPTPWVNYLATYATGQHVTLLFNTGRTAGSLGKAVKELEAAGYTVGGICGRTDSSETLTHSKQRCRQSFIDQGYTLIANVGNRNTDFTGGGYERAYRLPNYGGKLA